MKKLLFYTILNEIYKKTKLTEINEEKLSKLLIELDKEGFTLTPVIESLNGLCTPYLKYKLEDLIIFNILNQSSPLHLTKEGLEYIVSETKQIYNNSDFKPFLKSVKKLIEKYIIK
ncbi:MAG: hypothetical protein ACTSRP_15090 [Candidatus Helarchaeota archaeon]